MPIGIFDLKALGEGCGILSNVELDDCAAVEKISGHLSAILDDSFRKGLPLDLDGRPALSRTLYARLDLAY